MRLVRVPLCLSLCLPLVAGGCSTDAGGEGGSSFTTSGATSLETTVSETDTADTTDTTDTTDTSESETSGDGDGDSGDGDSGDGDGDHVYAMTVYLNFDGVTLTSGTDDATMDSTQIAEQAAVLEPYDASGTGDMHLFVAQEVANDFAAYDVQIVIERPAAGPYTMIVVTPTNNVQAGISGTGPQDCDNANVNNIGFAFFSSESTQSANIQAASVERIIGFTLGFDQVVTSADIMSASNASPNPSWQDQCFAFASLPGACLPQHAVACPDGESQNSAAELLAMFGPAVDP